MEILTEKNLIQNWKYCEVIECDDLEKSKYDWQRIAILKFNDKIYYTVINSNLIMKVVPIEELPYVYKDGKFYDKDEAEIDHALETIKNYFDEAE